MKIHLVFKGIHITKELSEELNSMHHIDFDGNYLIQIVFNGKKYVPTGSGLSVQTDGTIKTMKEEEILNELSIKTLS